MGTRNLTCVIEGGEFRVAQYGQWDGYPSGQGVKALSFARDRLEDLRSRLPSCRFIPDDEYERRYKAIGVGEAMLFGSQEHRAYRAEFPLLDRDHGAEILRLICDREGVAELRDSRGFAHDSLFCEWAYVIDFDRGVFEAYEGFNQDKLADPGVFASVPVPDRDDESGYESVRLVASWPLNCLPSDEAFLGQLEKEEV